MTDALTILRRCPQLPVGETLPVTSFEDRLGYVSGASPEELVERAIRDQYAITDRAMRLLRQSVEAERAGQPNNLKALVAVDHEARILDLIPSPFHLGRSV